MSQLVLDQMRRESQGLVQDRPRCRAKAVSGHLVFGDAHAAQGGEDGVI
jgi:hypothetical protein